MLTTRIRNSLRTARQALQKSYLERPHPARFLRAHSKLIDSHLIEIWQAAKLPDSFALVAVGGYGRAELYPKSDVDLLLLLPAEASETEQNSLQTLIGQLWDIGLEVGHSVRTIAQCIEQSSDITVQTNLLEARCLTGSHTLFAQLQATLIQHLDPRAFFTAKQQEQMQRHTRFLDIDFNLEPNLKESPGGLRDLQTVLWISRACGFGHTWRDLERTDLITPNEARQIAQHERFLQDLRIRLHYLSGRHDDRLVFEYQLPVAEQLGFVASPHLRASERMMRGYYQTRRAVLQLNDVLLQTMRARIFPASTQLALNERFSARDDKLEANSESLFEKYPDAILESFLLLEKHPELSGFSAPTLRALWRARHLIGAKFRADSNNRKLFMQIVRNPQGLTHALRRMNQQDILSRYLPAFGRVVGQMQHDLFHVYTVDEHILMVIRNLRRFTVEQYVHEFPLCSKLISEFARPEVLYLAGLFHDIAKGRGGDHSQLGRADATRFCKQHGLMREDRKLIVWLVENHLTMSATAQKQDLSDQDVIATFSAKIKNERYLIALYLLTVADIRGTSAKVWNAWKGKLLEDLFQATRRYLNSGKVADQVGEVKQLAGAALSLDAIHPDTYQLLWAQLEPEYFIRHEAHEIAWHARQLAHHVGSNTPIVKARISKIEHGLQVLIYSQDQPALFARICQFFARMNYNIMEAKVHTTQHGYALDSFLVMDASNEQTAYRDVMNYIEYELTQHLISPLSKATEMRGRVNRQLKHFPITPQVSIATDDKGRHILTVIAGDRPGLLARIAQVLAQHNIELRSAKINTLGARAEDTFWIGDDAKIIDEDSRLLCETLQQQLI
ncbi:MAG: [protein-PII] uridylyltransferase [Sideroxydans sp.]|nr:[protein-PII] uridylyltransferase [Sideroxydans sp.]